MKSASISSTEEILARIGRRIDRLRESIHLGEIADDLRDDIAREFKRIGHQVAAARAEVSQDLAITRQDLTLALGDELDVWRARVQDLRVQAELGRMELRDRLEPLIERAHLLIERIGKDIESLTQVDVIDDAELERSLRSGLKELRHEIETAEGLRAGRL